MIITTPVEVLNQVHVTGLTGNDEDWVDLSEQVIYLNESAEIQGDISEPIRLIRIRCIYIHR